MLRNACRHSDSGSARTTACVQRPKAAGPPPSPAMLRGDAGGYERPGSARLPPPPAPAADKAPPAARPRPIGSPPGTFPWGRRQARSHWLAKAAGPRHWPPPAGRRLPGRRAAAPGPSQPWGVAPGCARRAAGARSELKLGPGRRLRAGRWGCSGSPALGLRVPRARPRRHRIDGRASTFEGSACLVTPPARVPRWGREARAAGGTTQFAVRTWGCSPTVEDSLRAVTTCTHRPLGQRCGQLLACGRRWERAPAVPEAGCGHSGYQPEGHDVFFLNIPVRGEALSLFQRVLAVTWA